MKDDHLYDKPPTIFQMITNFSRDVVEYVKHGRPNVSIEDYKERLNECNKCPHIKKDKMRCNLCGCLLEHKAKWKTAKCPDKPERWKLQIIDDEKQGDNNSISGDKV